VIQRINQQFISVTVPGQELKRLADLGNEVAREAFRHWQRPLILVFLTPERQFVTKLSSLTDLTEVHPDSSRRPEAPQTPSLNSGANNARTFLKHLNEHFPNQGNP
jgi:hypothetical protein